MPNGNFVDMVSQVMQMGNNPQQFLQSQIQQNPQFAQQFGNIQKMMNGSRMTSKQFAIQYCKQNGIPEDQVMQVAKMLGLK